MDLAHCLLVTGYCYVLRPRNEAQLERAKKLITSQAAIIINVGRWHPIAEELLPNWDVIKQAPIWCDEQWKPFRLAAMKPLVELSVHAIADSKSVVIRLEDGGSEKSTEEIADDDSHGGGRVRSLYATPPSPPPPPCKAGARPAGQGLESNRHCGWVVGAS